MSEPEVPKKKGWGCLQWGVVIVSLILLGLYFMPCYCCITVKANQMKAGSNARQIIGLLLTYAADNNGQYPNAIKNPITHKLPQTANEAFRALVQEGLVQDETIFGCPVSRFMPDKNIGEAPAYDQALIAGENHWMMVVGMTNTSPSHYPLVMENTADATWPPRWFAGKSMKPVRGRTWENDDIIVGFNDASVQTVRLEKKGDYLCLPKSVLEPEGKPPLPVMKLLEIEEAGKGSYVKP